METTDVTTDVTGGCDVIDIPGNVTDATDVMTAVTGVIGD